jgi:hypothetical protein
MKLKDDGWSKEAYIARQLAIVAKYTKVQLKPKPTAEQKAEEAWGGDKKPIAAVLQDAQRAEEAATATLRDKRTQAQKDHDERVKSQHDLAWRQAAIDAAWQRSMAYRQELERWGAGTCHRGPGDPDWRD